MKDRWKTKVDALIRLAEDQAGKPEGELAREKLASILKEHPGQPLGEAMSKMLDDYYRRMVAVAFGVPLNFMSRYADDSLPFGT